MLGTIPMYSGVFDTSYLKNTGSIISVAPIQKCQKCGKELPETEIFSTLCTECLNNYGIT